MRGDAVRCVDGRAMRAAVSKAEKARDESDDATARA
jgi:hypothetical protein